MGERKNLNSMVASHSVNINYKISMMGGMSLMILHWVSVAACHM